MRKSEKESFEEFINRNGYKDVNLSAKYLLDRIEDMKHLIIYEEDGE